MQRVEWNVPLSEEAKQAKAALVQKLLNDSLIVKWMQDNQVDSTFIEQHAYKFKDYLERKSLCKNCHGLSSCMQKAKGNILELKYEHGALSFEVHHCEFSKRKQALLHHRERFLYCDMSESQLLNSFDGIDLMKENTNYIALVSEMLKACKEGSNKGFYLCGEPGVGKTYLCCCFINEMAKQGKRCAFANVPAFMSSLKGKLNDKTAYQKQIDALCKADVAVLDDIGGESATNWTRDEILLTILNERMENHRLTLFTSNYDMTNLERYYALNSKIMNDCVGAKRLLERMKALSSIKVLNCGNRRQ